MARPGECAWHSSLTIDRNGRSPFAGYHVTGFTNDEEAAVGLASKAPWLMEDAVRSLRVEFSSGDVWKPYALVDRNFYTGQKPACGPVA